MKLLTTIIQIIGSVIRFLAKQGRLWCSVTSFKKSLMLDGKKQKNTSLKLSTVQYSTIQYSRKKMLNVKKKSIGLSCLVPVCNCCHVIAIFFHLIPRKERGGEFYRYLLTLIGCGIVKKKK